MPSLGNRVRRLAALGRSPAQPFVQRLTEHVDDSEHLDVDPGALGFRRIARQLYLEDLAAMRIERERRGYALATREVRDRGERHAHLDGVVEHGTRRPEPPLACPRRLACRAGRRHELGDGRRVPRERQGRARATDRSHRACDSRPYKTPERRFHRPSTGSRDQKRSWPQNAANAAAAIGVSTCLQPPSSGAPASARSSNGRASPV